MELMDYPGRWLLWSPGFDFLAVSINRRLPREPGDWLNQRFSINRRHPWEPVWLKIINKQKDRLYVLFLFCIRMINRFVAY